MWNSAINWLFGSGGVRDDDSASDGVQSSSDARKLSWVFIGLSDMSWNLAETMISNPRFHLTGLIAADKVPGSQFASQFGTSFWEQEAELVKAADKSCADVAFISGPVDARWERCLWALTMGWHVVVESPFALSRSDAEFICDKAKFDNLLFMEIYPGTCCPGINKLLDLILSGSIGKARMVALNCGAAASLGEEAVVQEGPHGDDAAFKRHAAWALMLLTRLYPDPVPWTVLALGDSAAFGTQVLIQAKAGECQMASVCFSSVAAVSGDGTVHGSEGLISLACPWWQPESFLLQRAELPARAETDAHGSPARAGPLDAYTQWSGDSPDGGRMRYSWCAEELRFKAGREASPPSAASKDRDSAVSWRQSDSGQSTPLPHTSSRVSDDGSLRGWVTEWSDSPHGDAQGLLEPAGDAADAELDLRQAALAAAAATLSPDHSDGEDAVNVLRWMEKHGSVAVSRVRSRRGGPAPTWSPQMWPPKRLDRLQYEVSQMRSVADEVWRCVSAGLLESPEAAQAASVHVAGVLEDVLSQLCRQSPAFSSRATLRPSDKKGS